MKIEGILLPIITPFKDEKIEELNYYSNYKTIVPRTKPSTTKILFA